MAALASKRERSDEVERPTKRARSDQWVKYDTSECEHARPAVFVDGVVEDFPDYARIEHDHPESDRSLCTQYLFWLYPDASFHVSPTTYHKFIDIRERDGRLYFFRAAGFFYFGNNGVEPELFTFYPQDYDIDYCLQRGAYADTTLQVLAFYYLKILPPHLKKNVYIHKTTIDVPLFDGTTLDADDALTENLWTFIAATPNESMGIANVGYLEHDMTLVFDSREKRLELYEPNGVDTKYTELQTMTMYEYLAEHLFEIHQERITNIWGNTFSFQKQDSSCSLWSSTMAMCRMSGISRDRLPTKTQDVIDITSMNRRIMWNVCGFDQFPAGLISLDVIDRALTNCQVPEDQSDKLFSMVMKHADYSPIPIPPVDFADFLDDLKEDTETCPKPLVVNLEQVRVTTYFIEYISDYCEQGIIVVRGKSLSDSSSALRRILRMPMLLTQLEMSEKINLSDVDTVRTLERLLGESPTAVLAVDTAVVHADNTIDILRPMRDRLWFDALILAKPMSDEARAVLGKIATKLVEEPNP